MLSMAERGSRDRRRRIARTVVPRPARGVTLIELITTLAVLIISLSLAAPAFTSFLRSNRLQAAQSELVSSLTLARSEAARKGRPVGVEAMRPLADGGFNSGWRVWVDANGNGVYDGQPPEEVVREVAARSPSLTVTPTSDVRGIVFAPSGFLVAGNAVTFCLLGQPETTKGFRVVLAPVGLADVVPVTEAMPCP